MDINKLTVENLRQATSIIEANAEKAGMPLDNHNRIITLSLQLLDHFMGEDWVIKNIIEKQGRPDYFRASAESEERYKLSWRVITFAEMLFNFQDVEGFPGRIPALRSGNVESGFAELQGAVLLYGGGFRIRFRNGGYDLDIILPEGDAAAEIKCKLESTELSTETVRNALKKAHDQLPTDRPCFIFLRIPEGWVRFPQIEGIMRSVLEEFFKNTGRIATVFLWWEEFVQQHGGGWWRLFRVREERNPKARFPAGPVTDLAGLSWHGKAQSTYLDEVVAETIHGAEDGSIVRIRTRRDTTQNQFPFTKG